MGMELLDTIAQEGLRTDIPRFDAGDTVKVMVTGRLAQGCCDRSSIRSRENSEARR